MNFKPLHDRILVKRKEAETRTAGGLLIPETASDKPSEGTVVAVGDGRRLDNGTIEALSVNVGDNIIFGKWSGTEVSVEGETYIIMTEKDIMGIVE